MLKGVRKKMISVLGENIKSHREKLGLSQYALEQQSGVGRSTIYKIENGDIQSISADKISALAKVFGIPVDHLIKPIDEQEYEFTDLHEALKFLIENDEEMTIDNVVVTDFEKEMLLNSIQVTIDCIKKNRHSK